MTSVNEFDQPVGLALRYWNPPPFPPHTALEGRYCHLEPLKAERHARDFWEAQAQDPNAARWTHTTFGPFANFDAFEKWCLEIEDTPDPQMYAIVVDGKAAGILAYMHVDPSNGVVEVGRVFYSLRLVKTRAATEAIYLLLANAFELGYRRFEWKCDSCNLPSSVAATRLGFTYEGTLRQSLVYKSRSCDTLWFAITDGDWDGGLKEAFESWLACSNFDDNGHQNQKLSELTAPFVLNKP